MRANLGEIYNETITVINILDAKDSDEKQDAYVKHFLDGCMWNIRTARTVEQDGTVTVGTTHVVQIPEDAEYLPYKEWAKLADKSTHFTIRPKDYVVLGKVTEELTALNLRKVILNYEPEAFQVQAFRDATKGKGFEHSVKGIMRFTEPYIVEG